jgi:small subunit ribosomal protein S6
MKKSEFSRDDAVKYELMVILNPEIGTDAISKQLDEIKEMLVLNKDAKPEIFFEDVWGLRDMAYRIKKHERGFYAVYDFLMDPSLIKELDTNLTLETNVIRHMIVKLPFAYEPKTLAKMEEDRIAEEEERQAKKPRGRNGQPEIRKEAVREEKKVEPVVVAAKEEKNEKKEDAADVKEEKPKKAAPKKEQKETTLEDVDAKLKSIIENPDINF